MSAIGLGSGEQAGLLDSDCQMAGETMGKTSRSNRPCTGGFVSHSAIAFIAWRYIKGSKKQRFASFVAILATLGIAIGVCALIVVSSIMQGLQDRLKANILSDCAHVVVRAQESDIPNLLNMPHVKALVPFVQGEAMMQSGADIIMVTLQATEDSSLYMWPATAQEQGFKVGAGGCAVPDSSSAVPYCRVHTPYRGSSHYNFGSKIKLTQGNYNLAMNYPLMRQLGLDKLTNNKVRLISTQNARYTPLGLTPVQRNFTIAQIVNVIDRSASPLVMGNYQDARAFFRLQPDESYYRLYLSDPFLIEDVAHALEGRFAFTDWRERYGDFFKAVGLEKITMSVMLCLIVVVAAFNILSSLTMVVSSRVGEIAILKTIGMSNGSLLTIFLWVGMSASILGSLLGVVLGIPLALNAQEILSGIGISIVQGELPIEIVTTNIILIVLLCLVVSLLCTFYPAYYASKADPVSNLVNS